MDIFTIVMLAVLALLIFFMFRNSRKRQSDARALQAKTVVGANVMTNFGVYGRVLSIDEEENTVLLETTPGTVLNLHRQTIARVIEDEKPEAIEEPAAASGEPEYGERIQPESESGAKADINTASEPKKTDD